MKLLVKSSTGITAELSLTFALSHDAPKALCNFVDNQHADCGVLNASVMNAAMTFKQDLTITNSRFELVWA